MSPVSLLVTAHPRGVSGARTWGQATRSWDPSGHVRRGRGLSTDIRGYLIALVELGDEPGLDDAADFDAALQTVDMRPDEGP